MLKRIIKHKQREIAALAEIDVSQLKNSPYDFVTAIRQGKPGVIAELKSKSPSQGQILQDYQPSVICQQYEKGGATAISVLTDQHFFNGSYEDLAAVREKCNLPLLCKDFFIDKVQVHYAHQAGADACLLIAAVLSDEEIISLKAEIERLGMAALIEVHTIEELQRVLKLDPQIIGINNRNLNDFSIDPERSNTLCDAIPDDIVIVAASGLNTPEEIAALKPCIAGVLVGTALMQSTDRPHFIQQLRAHYAG